ncbi:MAG TPA: CHAT domain-containing tetratricopeptide repeat protein [Pyrinomonadaceae bacterium]|nr:CHAT domain-containing tetratricopeptide repeat protein [Pyrinomonadaceae bacterium]
MSLSLYVSLLALPPVCITPVSTASANSNGPPAEATALIADADALRGNWKEADLRESLAKYDHAAQVSTSISDQANARLKAADVCFLLGEYAGALQRYKTVVAMSEKTGDRLAQGTALSQIGRVESYMGNNDLAQQHANQALSLLKFAETDSNPLVRTAYGNALASMGEINYSKGNFVKSLEQFRDALGYLDQDREVQARAHRFIAFISASRGNLGGVQAEIQQALELSRGINDKTGEGLALSLLGLFYAYSDAPNHGIDLQRKALDIFRAIGDRHSEAVALNALAQSYQVLGEDAFVISNFEKAVSLFESVGALDLVAVNSLNLATMYHKVGKHEQALKSFDRSLKLSRAAGKRRSEANVLTEIASVYASQKRYDEAVSLYREVLHFYKTRGDGRGQATALNKYGDFLLMTGAKEQALVTYNEALALSEKVEDNEILTSALLNLARAQQALGNFQAGLAYIERSLKVIEELREGVGTPGLRVSFFSGAQEHYELCRDILVQLDHVRPGEGFADRAFLINEKSRARSLVDMVAESRSQLRDKASAELLAREREVGSSITELAKYKLELSPDSKGDSAELAEIDRKMVDLNAAYEEAQADLRRQNLQPSSHPGFELQDVAQVQRALGDNTMLLEYSLGVERSYLWAITSGSFQTYELPDRKTIEDAAKKFYELTTARQKLAEINADDYRGKVEEADRLLPGKAREFSQLLLGPVAEQLGNRKLVFVTEGLLQLAPFESLPPPNAQPARPGEAKKYLVHSNAIVRLPSMTTLLALRAAANRHASSGNVAAVIADPVFSSSDDRVASQETSATIAHAADSPTEQTLATRGLRSSNLARLVHSSQEADAIFEMAPRGTVMVAKGFDASRETAMSPRVGEYQIVHFATHGFVDNEHPELSGIGLTMVDQNGATKNGIMPLHDIYSLDLAAELTVLSACETALGEDVKGEGLVGLTHSFMSAGSKSVVASLWKVDDQATAVFMVHFYESMFRERLQPAAALRAAQLKMMQDKQWSEPYYWAGFVFQGDYESQIDVTGSFNPLKLVALLLAILIAVGVIVFWRRRRQTSPA